MNYAQYDTKCWYIRKIAKYDPEFAHSTKIWSKTKEELKAIWKELKNDKK